MFFFLFNKTQHLCLHVTLQFLSGICYAGRFHTSSGNRNARAIRMDGRGGDRGISFRYIRDERHSKRASLVCYI